MSKYNPNKYTVSSNELRERHNISMNKTIYEVGCECRQEPVVLDILKKNFTIPSLFIRNFPDFLVVDDSAIEPPYFIEAKTECCKTLEFTQLYQNKEYCNSGIPVYYSLGKNILILATKISHSHVIVSPKSKEYFDRDWKNKLEKEGDCIVHYRDKFEGMGSSDPFVYVDYNFLRLYFRGLRSSS